MINEVADQNNMSSHVNWVTTLLVNAIYLGQLALALPEAIGMNTLGASPASPADI